MNSISQTTGHLPTRPIRFFLQRVGRARFIRFGIRDRIIRFFHSPDLLVHKEFKISFYGKQYRGNFDTFIDWTVYYYGAYGLEELELIQDSVKIYPGRTFLDIGANVGHHTLFASGIFSNVISVEPFEGVYSKLLQKIHDNKLMNVRAFKMALGNKEEVKHFLPPDSTNSGTGTFIHKNKTEGVLELRVTQADKVLTDVDLDSLAFIKIDTEGYEAEILKGMKNILDRWKPFVFFEWTQSSPELRAHKYLQTLFPPGYSFYQFYHNLPFLFLFQKRGYELKRIKEKCEEGMILAIPDELARRTTFKEWLRKTAAE